MRYSSTGSKTWRVASQDLNEIMKSPIIFCSLFAFWKRETFDFRLTFAERSLLELLSEIEVNEARHNAYCSYYSHYRPVKTGWLILNFCLWNFQQQIAIENVAIEKKTHTVMKNPMPISGVMSPGRVMRQTGLSMCAPYSENQSDKNLHSHWPE